jgi:hypothetical protein
MGETAGLFVWSESELWAYSQEHSCCAREYFEKTECREHSWGQVIFAIHPSAIQLVGIDVVGVLSKKNFKRHQRHCLALHLDKKLKDRQCFPLDTVELADGVYKHWVGVCDGSALLTCWEWLYGKLQKKPEVVAPVLWLKSAWETSLNCRYSDVVILHHEGDAMILMIYRNDQFVFYESFIVNSDFLVVFLQRWNYLIDERVVEMTDQLLIVKKEGHFLGNMTEYLSWCGGVNVMKVAANEKHSSIFLSAAWRGL